LTYGFCKYEGKGCEYNHNKNPPKVSTKRSQSPEISKKNLTETIQAAPYVPVNSMSEYVPTFAPEFVPSNVEFVSSAEYVPGTEYVPSEYADYDYEGSKRNTYYQNFGNHYSHSNYKVHSVNRSR
jgi:ribosomal protein L28